MIAMTMKAAKEFAPSIIYLDEAEKIFPAKKKGKRGKKKGGAKKKSKNDPANPARIKKTLIKWKAKWITDETRITLIGCSSEPENGSKKDFKKIFDRAIYFPFPDYNTARLMWKTFILEFGGQIGTDFPLQTLASVSYGYSTGSIRSAVEFVLTADRVAKLDHRPLKVSEFIGRLGSCSYTHEEKYASIKKFTDQISGDALRRKKLAAEIDDDDGTPGGKKKKAKGKKKKR